MNHRRIVCDADQPERPRHHHLSTMEPFTAERFGGMNPLGETIRIGNVSFTVKGVFKTKGASLGGGDRDNRIVIPISTASRRLSNQTYLNEIMVQVDDLAEMKSVAENVTSLLRARHSSLLLNRMILNCAFPKK